MWWLACCGQYVWWYYVPSIYYWSYAPKRCQFHVVPQCLCKGCCSIIAEVVTIKAAPHNNTQNDEIRKNRHIKEDAVITARMVVIDAIINWIEEQMWWLACCDHYVCWYLLPCNYYWNHTQELFQCNVVLQCNRNLNGYFMVKVSLAKTVITKEKSTQTVKSN